MFADMVNATDKYEGAIAMQPEAACANPVVDTNSNLGHEGDRDLDPEEEQKFADMVNATDKFEGAIVMQPEAACAHSVVGTIDECDATPPRRRGLRKAIKKTPASPSVTKKGNRRPVGQRWYYEVVQPVLVAANPTAISTTDNQIKCSEFFEDETGKGLAHPEEKKNTEKSDLVPYDDALTKLGKVEAVSLAEIESTGNDEWTAWCLQGVLFYDEDLEWCRILGWGVECGILILHYAPISANGSIQCEHHASLADVLSLIK